MSSLRAAPPRPATSRVGPGYPRVIAAFAIVLAGCGGVVQHEGRDTEKPETEKPASPSTDLFPSGTSPGGWDSGQPDVETGETQLPSPDPGGAVDAPFEDVLPDPADTAIDDSRPAPTDAGADAADSLPEPSPDGFAPTPFDGGAAPSDPGADPGADPGEDAGL
ncbi:MAG: hypothetical protein HYV09_05695 [Deltaproteobacteria bacterium]|nr:hypothetical protein [Deltaproteobacteria bacterium]